MLLDCGSCSVEDASASQPVLLVSVLGRERNALPEFAFKNDNMVGFCEMQVQIQTKYMTALNNVDSILGFEAGMQMVDIKKSLEQMENWLSMLV